MACRLASVPVLTVSVLKRLQDLGRIQFFIFDETNEKSPSRAMYLVSFPLTRKISGNVGAAPE